MNEEAKATASEAAEEAEKKRLLHLYVACGATVLLVFASFHPIDMGMLAWVALVPWLFVALRGTRRCAIVTSYGTTFLYHLLGLSWIGLVTAPGWVATTFLEGFYSVAIVLAVRWMRGRTRLPVSVLLPPLWVMGEHHRGAHLLFIKFPWLLLGQTQHARTWLIQLADVTSIYGLSFLVVLVNAFVLDVLLLLARRNEEQKDLGDEDRRSLMKLAAYPATLLLLANLYGAIRASQVASDVIPGPRILAVQCDVPQEVKESFDSDPAPPLADENFALTKSALATVPRSELPDAILWSETVWLYPFNYEYPETKKFDDIWVSYYQRRDPPSGNYRGGGRILAEKTEELFSLPKLYGCDFIFGAFKYSAMEDYLTRDAERHVANRVYQITPEKKIAAFYDKINLVPASEGIPGKGTWFYSLLKSFVPPGFQTLEPGEGPVIMELAKPPHWKLSCDICFEISFPELLRQGTALGADVLFCPSNDGWFHASSLYGKPADDIASAEIPLALDHAIFRAIENRRGVVRIVNRGITCFIDPLGRVVDRVTATLHRSDGVVVPDADVHVRGTIQGAVPTSRLMSFYVRFGDLFAWLTWIASACLLGFSFTRKDAPVAASS
jgi:apolipoprotein N-acyltransferase